MEARDVARGEAGFTIVEVLVAACVLVTGLLAMLTMLETSASGLAMTRARQGATAVHRELIEAVRAVPFDQLTPNGTGALIRAQGALGDAALDENGWTVRRQGVTYTISLGVCAVDDPRDGTGSHDAGSFCAGGAGSSNASSCRSLLGVTGQVAANLTASAQVGDCGIDLNADGVVDGLVDVAGTVCVGVCAGGVPDAVPADYKRVVSLVTWTGTAGTRWVLQSTTIANPGLSGTPTVTALSAPGIPVTSSATTAVNVALTTSAVPATTAWYVDGTAAGTASGAGTAWNFTWPLGTVSAGSTPVANEVTDGPYLIGARSFDANSQPGPIRTLTVVVNRRAPYPPQEVEAGFDGAAVAVEWAPAVEHDIAGYRVQRSSGAGWTVVCDLTTQTGCRDNAPPPIGASYRVIALDRDPQGALREGTPSATVVVVPGNHAPPPPSGLHAAHDGANVTLGWTAGAADPDLGDAIDHYVIYRDGLTAADVYDRTGDATQLTYVDTATGGVAHTYAVAAVDSHLATSTLIGPVAP